MTCLTKSKVHHQDLASKRPLRLMADCKPPHTGNHCLMQSHLSLCGSTLRHKNCQLLSTSVYMTMLRRCLIPSMLRLSGMRRQLALWEDGRISDDPSVP